MNLSQAKDLLTPQDVMGLLGIKTGTFRTLIRKGLPRMPLYPGARKYVVSLEDLKKFLQQNKMGFDSISI